MMWLLAMRLAVMAGEKHGLRINFIGEDRRDFTCDTRRQSVAQCVYRISTTYLN